MALSGRQGAPDLKDLNLVRASTSRRDDRPDLLRCRLPRILAGRHPTTGGSRLRRPPSQDERLLVSIHGGIGGATSVLLSLPGAPDERHDEARRTLFRAMARDGKSRTPYGPTEIG